MFPLCFAPLGDSFVFLDVGLPFCSLFHPFLGALVNLWLAGFHQLGIAHKMEQDTKIQRKKSVHIQTNLSL
jgi:hypothetical protein